MMDAVASPAASPSISPPKASQRSGRSSPRPRDVPEARAALRQHGLAAGPHGRGRHARVPISRAGSARAASSGAPRGAISTRGAITLSALRHADLQGPDAPGRRRQRPHLGSHRRGRREPGSDRGDARRACPTGRSAPRFPRPGAHAKDLRSSRRSAATCSPMFASPRRDGRPLPSARRLVAAMAAARGGDRGQHRRRLPLCNKSFNGSYSGCDLWHALHAAPGPPAPADRSRPRRRRSGTRGARRRGQRRPPRGRSGGASRSGTSTPARATAANSRSTRSTTPSTTSSGSASASSPRPGTPTSCW